MKRTIALSLLICLFSLSLFAGTESTSPTTPTPPKEVTFILHKPNNKTLRTPSGNYSEQIEGTYNEDGVLSINLFNPAKWNLTVFTNTGTDTYVTSTEDLAGGIYIGFHASFIISLSNDSGEHLIGEVNTLE